MTPILELSNVCKWFGEKQALSRVGLSHKKGEILCLLGASGSGKTTLLRVIAGLETPDAGRVCFDGQPMTGVKAWRRRFGMMFQEFALFPHKNVLENVGFGLKMEGKSHGAIQRRAKEMLAMVGLDGFEKRDVGSLSGGERQRAALARSLAPNPRLLLLDEPMGALDRTLRERLMIDLKEIIKTVGTTTLFVTHDQAEAFAVSDRIAVMSQGEIKQNQTPENLYRRPAGETVARFLGFKNIFSGVADQDGGAKTALGRLSPLPEKKREGQDIMALIRPEAGRWMDHDTLTPDETTRFMEPIISGRVTQRLFRGTHYQTCIETEQGQRLHLDLASAPQVGETARVALLRDQVVLI